MNFRHFGNQFKSSYSKFGGANAFTQGSRQSFKNFTRSYATMNNMTLRMAQRGIYNYSLGSYMASKGIMGTPSLISMMLHSQATTLFSEEVLVEGLLHLLAAAVPGHFSVVLEV